MTTATLPHSTTLPAGSPTGGPAEDGRSPTPPETMPDAPLRAVAYIRESTEEQGQGFSPDAQRERIREFAPENDLLLIGEYCDFHSGWRKSSARPEFQRLMADAAEGKFDVVLVIAQWLNATGARTARGRPFGKDAVRGILSNAAYCGYVTGKRETTLTTKGLHEPIVPEELFERDPNEYPPRRAARPAHPPSGPLRPGRPAESAVRHAPPGDRGGAAATRRPR
ncbi:MAG TPA: recombinase family protein [Solirubrobacteraceae bacterium]|nr:recombinase family protein [Solirubrobacteraceae bacterium]